MDILYHGEAQILAWGETNASGPWVKLRLDSPEALAAFRSLKGAEKSTPIVHVTVATGDIIAAVTPQSAPESQPESQPELTYGDYWRDVKLSGWCRRPDVWRAMGTDADFLAWLRTQKCAARLLGSAGPCGGDIVAAHVRRVANGAGTGIKPEYSAIALCDRHHQLQHHKGESALGGKEWVDRERIKALEKWAWESMRKAFNVDSMRYVSPEDAKAWASGLLWPDLP